MRKPLLSPGITVRLTGLVMAIGCLAGQLWSAVQTEERIRGANDAVLASEAARYLAVVTPASPTTGFDARRLVSGANTVLGASFWPGGFQMALGTAPLVPDVVGLLPLPDSLTARLEGGGSATVITRGGLRTALVPFEGQPGGGVVGWAAAWNTLPSGLRSWPTALALCLALGGCGWSMLAGAGRRPRHVAIGLLVLFTLEVGFSVRRTAVASTASRILTARRLIEIAATAPGVRQARLPEIGVGLEVRDTSQVGSPPAGLITEFGPAGPVARTVALTPRTQSGLELRLRPVEVGLGGLWLSLLGWLALGTAGLVLGGRAAGLSGPSGLFHSAGRGAGSPPGEGH